MDYHLQTETALDFIDVISARMIDIPVIVVTGDDNEELHALLISHGVLDLIQKEDISPLVLAQSIRFAVRRREIDQEIFNLLPPEIATTEA